MNKERQAEHLLISTATILSHSVSGQVLHLEKKPAKLCYIMPHLALMGLQLFLWSGTLLLEGGIQRSEWESSFVIYFPVWPQEA